MAIQISYKDKTYQKGHEIKVLSDLIIDNINLLNLLGELYMAYDKSKDKNKFNELLEKYMNIYVLTGDVSEEVASAFKERWINMSNENIGIVLEQLIANKGPYKPIFDNVDYSTDVVVHNTGRKNNFDIVFFENNHNLKARSGQTIDIEGYIEFHECKKNICNEIPVDPGKRLKNSMRKKIELISLTNDLVEEGNFYFPTLHINVESQQSYLNDLGYGYIEILNIDKLITRYCD